jgi:hypothetical protein
MDDPRIMRRLQRLRCLRHNLQPGFQRHLLNPALPFAPTPQVLTRHILLLQVKGRLIEVNLIQAHDMGVLSSPFLQQSEERDLTLEAAQPVGPEAELEDAPLLDGLMPTYPHFPEAAFAQLLFQHPWRIRNQLPHGWSPS